MITLKSTKSLKGYTVNIKMKERVLLSILMVLIKFIIMGKYLIPIELGANHLSFLVNLIFIIKGSLINFISIYVKISLSIQITSYFSAI